jgi:hypothetical protein
VCHDTSCVASPAADIAMITATTLLVFLFIFTYNVNEMMGKRNTGNGRGTRLRACGAEAYAAPAREGRSDRPPGRRSVVPPNSVFFQYSKIPTFHYSLCLFSRNALTSRNLSSSDCFLLDQARKL